MGGRPPTEFPSTPPQGFWRLSLGLSIGHFSTTSDSELWIPGALNMGRVKISAPELSFTPRPEGWDEAFQMAQTVLAELRAHAKNDWPGRLFS